MKPYKLGITVGRFQTFHLGHKDMLDKAIAICDRVAVFVGSSNEAFTNKNPYTYEMRRDILKKVFGDAIEIYPLPDIGVGNNSKWGDYVLQRVKECCNISPDLFISGKESRRIDWFAGAQGLSVAELYIPKTIDISACRMRELLADGDFNTWKAYTDKSLWSSFDGLREIILKTKDNLESGSM